MTRVNKQIQVVRNGEHIVLNTEGHGVMYCPTSELSLESGTLSLKDLVTLLDQNKESY